jgi:hypothetical protein
MWNEETSPFTEKRGKGPPACYGGLEGRSASRSRGLSDLFLDIRPNPRDEKMEREVAKPRQNGLTCQSRIKYSACSKVTTRAFSGWVCGRVVAESGWSGC